ncbi:cytochrome c [Thioalkalivibrio sp. XN8]|uniref:c-type cytochrome n=1 Tax=Thioalkalivibrio sp. XN8 TaxID=2712863 RepID=UPI0013EA4E7F|nr:cytochrome c [Thioalkalivibrio sp. XN8]NGP54513.1 c-type cytochrome [Thioalkalivibrio sp. XN8]
MHWLFAAVSATALSLLSFAAQAADVDAGKAAFQQHCAICHGPTGEADSPTAAALDPQPRVLSDAGWQASVDDEYLRKVIREGGPAVGLSPLMVAQRGLSDKELANVVAYIRSLAE